MARWKACGTFLFVGFLVGMLLVLMPKNYTDVQSKLKVVDVQLRHLRPEGCDDIMVNQFDPGLLQQYLRTHCPWRPDLIPIYNYRSNITTFDDVILVITFNYAVYYDVIPLLELMYRRTFKNIIYCGRGFNVPDYNVTFLTISDKYEGAMTGSFMFECMNKAIDLNTYAKGYLLIGDDTLFYPWTWNKNFDDNKAWIRHGNEGMAKYNLKTACWSKSTCDAKYLKNVSKYPDLLCENTTTPWMWWKYYKKETVQAYENLMKSTDPILKECYGKLIERNGGMFYVNYQGIIGDGYYIPRRLARKFAVVSRLFEEYKVMLEIVIPTCLQCIEGLEHLELVNAINLWMGRDKLNEQLLQYIHNSSDLSYNQGYIDRSNQEKIEYELKRNGSRFFHPFKLNNILSREEPQTSVFCNSVLDWYLKH